MHWLDPDTYFSSIAWRNIGMIDPDRPFVAVDTALDGATAVGYQNREDGKVYVIGNDRERGTYSYVEDMPDGTAAAGAHKVLTGVATMFAKLDAIRNTFWCLPDPPEPVYSIDWSKYPRYLSIDKLMADVLNDESLTTKARRIMLNDYAKTPEDEVQVARPAANDSKNMWFSWLLICDRSESFPLLPGSYSTEMTRDQLTTISREAELPDFVALELSELEKLSEVHPNVFSYRSRSVVTDEGSPLTEHTNAPTDETEVEQLQRKLRAVLEESTRRHVENTELRRELEDTRAKVDKHFRTGQANNVYETVESQLLGEAIGTINGDRQNMYGNAENSFPIMAELWSTWLTARFSETSTITGKVTLQDTDVAMMMLLYKVGRETQSPKRDSRVDMAGYIGLYERCLSQRV